MPVYGSHLVDYEELKLGQRIREERQRQGLTLKDIAGRLNLSTARLSQIENDHHRLDLGQALAIADALGIPRTAFLPADTRLPYQISRDADVRARPPRETRLARWNQKDTVAHHNAFWPLAELFVGRHVEPLLGRIGSVPDEGLPFYYHHEEEFVFALKGTLEFLMRTPEGIRREVIHRGDCVYLRSSYPHCLRSLDSEPAETIHVIAAGPTPIETAFDSISLRPVVYLEHERQNRAIPRMGENLRVFRDAHGWTLDQVARLVGLSERQLLQFERGDRAIGLDVMLKLARAYGKPLREFIGHLKESELAYFIQRSGEIPLIPSRKRRTPVELPDMPTSGTFQPLASGFPARSMYPYFIRIRNVDLETLAPHEHHGQEFIYVLDGQLELTTYAEDQQVKETLRSGDSCYIDSSVPHLLRGHTRNPYSETSAEVIDVFWCPLGEQYLFDD